MQRKVAAALFDTPPESSYQEAEKYFLKAQEIDPSYKRNAFALAETYYAMSNKSKCKEWMEKVYFSLIFIEVLLGKMA